MEIEPNATGLVSSLVLAVVSVLTGLGIFVKKGDLSEYVTRQELHNTEQQLSNSVIRVEQKIDLLVDKMFELVLSMSKKPGKGE